MIKIECGKCVHFEQSKKDKENDEYYTCKYLDNESVGFIGDSVSTAECCDYYKEVSKDHKTKQVA